MNELANNLDKLYEITGDISDLFDETNMFFKSRENDETKNAINDINDLLERGSLNYVEDSSKMLQSFRIEIEKIDERIKELDSKIQSEEKTLEEYKKLEHTEENDKLIEEVNARIREYRKERKNILLEKDSLNLKLKKIEELQKLISNKNKQNKKYKISHNISLALTESLSKDDFELKGSIIAIEDKEISEEEYNELFEKFANAIDKDMSIEKKSRLKGILFPYVTRSFEREYTREDANKLKAIIAGYKAEIVIEEELHSEPKERENETIVPVEESKKSGMEVKENGIPKRPVRPVMPSMAEQEKPIVAVTDKKDEMSAEMEPRTISANQTIAVLMANGVLPALEEEEMIEICNQLHINISKEGLNTVINEEQLQRLLLQKDIRELLLKDSINKKTDEVLNEYNSMLNKYDELIAKIEKYPTAFSEEFLNTIKNIRNHVEVARKNYIISSEKHLDSVEFKDRRITDIESKLSKQYSEYEKFKNQNKTRKMNKVYQKINKLRGKEIKLMSKQVRIANKNCDRFLEIVNREHASYQKMANDVQFTSQEIIDYQEEIDSRIERNMDIRDQLITDFDRGLSRKEIRELNREVRVNDRIINRYNKKQGKVDRRFQHRQKIARLEDYYNQFSR